MDGSLPFDVQVALGDEVVRLRSRVAELERERDQARAQALNDAVDAVDSLLYRCTDCDGRGVSMYLHQCETCCGHGEIEPTREEYAAAIRALKEAT